MLGNILQQTYSLIDAAIVGKMLGVNALAAVGASVSIVFLILGFCQGCCCGFAIPVAQKLGARDIPAVRRTIWAGLRISLYLSIVICIVTSLLCDEILAMMKTPQQIFDYVAQTGTLPKTAACTEESYAEQFEKFLDGYDALIHFNISSKVSRSLSTNAKNMA